MLTPENRLAILMHGGIRGQFGKTGLGLLRYSQNPIVAVIDAECVGDSIPRLTGIPREVPIVASVRDALAYQPDTLVIGIAPSGGLLPPELWQEVRTAVMAGLNLVNGLHTPLANHPDLQPLLHGCQWIWDIRQEPPGLSVGTGKARFLPCKRVLTVGTDMAVGKMTVSLEMHRACLQRGLRSRFLATGQTGIMIEGSGVPLDAVRVDFASGAVEKFVLELAQDADVIHIEGQGALTNPASTATLPLLRGSQPTHLILVHRAGQTHIRTFPDVPIPPLPEVIRVYEQVASMGGAFYPSKVVAVALNTAHLSESEARAAVAQVEAETGLPCTDPVRFGAGRLLAAIEDEG
ncbi:MAG: DUF1611 domain-containing protein [Armatimonadota bacterium]|nr:DUF1611 domain-containing protein [Armatimonadota bacterium]